MSDKAKTPEGRVSGAVLVAGAGIAGMQAALDLADSGFMVYLVEKNISIGGIMAQLDKTFPTNDCSTCMISPKLIEVSANPNVEILSRATITGISGQPGDFTVKVLKEPRFIDEDVCSGCGECVKVCPIEVPADFNLGLNTRKAIYRHFPQAIPSAYAVDKLGVSPCKDACPAGISVQGYVALTAQGRYKEALALIRQANPLPAVCGRVCTHPCESACNRAAVDEAVAIRDLKKFLTQWEADSGEVAWPEKKAPRQEKVAVIGAGPAGLTAAYYLALEGFPVTVYEALDAPGGMLRVGIPDYRLPQDVLDFEIDYIRRLGVEIKTGSPVSGRELETLSDQGFAAAFVSVGAHKGLRLGVEGEGLPGVIGGVEFLREAGLGLAQYPGERVAVIGGGNVAIDAARTALRLGSREVTILYRRTREEMPAYGEEIDEALEEGVRIEYLAAPARFVEQGGSLAAIEAVRMELGEPDASGRRRPVPLAGSEFTLEVDAVLTAIGQAPDLDFLEPRTALGVGRGSRLAADPLTLQTSLPWVFAGGDAVSGPATVVEAINHGKAAAESIRRFVDGEDLAAGRSRPVRLAKADPAGIAKLPRRRPPHEDPNARKGDFREVVGTLAEADARAEAARCLACGVCSECYQCLSVCQAGAIDHAMTPKEVSLKVGAVVMAPGFVPFDARLKSEFGYGRYPNVLTSLEFERVLSASGPYGGHVQRPGDGAEPKQVAWIQCVGSRDPAHGRDYCSYVCCMYASKQAIIAGEHVPGLTPTIFYMDIRAQGKGFDRYYERAKSDHNVRYVRSMPSRIIEEPGTGNLILSYFDERDHPVEEVFDLVILSVGLTPNPAGRQLADTLEVATDRFGFARTVDLNPLLTSREGVFTCGAFQAPRDIPDTVMQASGAAAEAGALLAAARGSQVSEAQFPPERSVAGEPPKIGVFICHCGINIAGTVNIDQVVDYAAGLPGVTESTNFLFTCSTDSQEKMAREIAEKGLNRVVVASCSPRTHEPLFRETCRRAGLNPYLFEMANIRDQCSWVHAGDPAAATEKAKDLVRMSVARAGLLAPLHQFPATVDQSAVVVGGGAAGLTAAVTLADMGFPVHLVERSGQLGGLARRIARTLEGFDVAAHLAGLVDRATHHGNIQVHLNSELREVGGHVGQFTGRLRGPGGDRQVNFGAAVIATGAREHQPEEYLFGQDERVTTQLALQEGLAAGPEALTGVGRVVMIQCVGSREPEHSYCSRVCCSSAVANALTIKNLAPETEVTVLFRDIRTFSKKELYYAEARKAGVRFVRFSADSPPRVRAGEGGIEALVYDQILNQWLRFSADRLVLSAAVRPQTDAHELASRLKLPLDADGFFMEAHMKLRPVDFVSSGFFMAGAAHGPKFLEESISQAKAAAARAATILGRAEMMVGGEVAVVDGERCVACLTCVRTCPYGVPRINEEGVAHIDPAACHGCGNCASACPRKLISVQHHTDAQILAKATAL